VTLTLVEKRVQDAVPRVGALEAGMRTGMRMKSEVSKTGRLVTVVAACAAVMGLQVGVASAAYYTAYGSGGTTEAAARRQFALDAETICKPYGGVRKYTIYQNLVSKVAEDWYSGQGEVWCNK
jgi:hypothetical protein